MNSEWLADQLASAEADGGIVVIDEGLHDDPVMDFAHSVARGLQAEPKTLECRFLYDAEGSALFGRICEQPEYYLTRTEAAILHRHAPDIAATTGEVSLVELGSGSSAKTQHILRAYLSHAGAAPYVPIDVSRAALEQAQDELETLLPDVDMAPVHGVYEHALPVLEALSPAMIIFLGSSIGNFDEDAADAFWTRIHASMGPDDYFLLGVDLVKDPAVIQAAYNDAAGRTEAFTRNLFARMNRELGASINVDTIEHVSRYNIARSRIETWARFAEAQEIHVAPLDTTCRVAANELVHTEISRKFDLASLVPTLARHGLTTRQVFTDGRDWFALLLLQKAAGHA